LLATDAGLRAAMGRHALQAVSGATWGHATDALRGHYLRACELVAERRPARLSALERGDTEAEVAAVAAPEPADPPREAA
jgi:hypothetical protein